MRRATYKVLGFCCLAVGAVGAVLPVLPSTIFFILAAACFARSSPKLEARMLSHPTIGPPIKAWRDHGVIPVRAKIFALAGMTAGFILFFWLTSPPVWLLGVVGLVIAACAGFVASRPSSVNAGE